MIHGREGETVFLHGARKARIVRLLEKTDSMCLNVTLVDGIVLARSAFQFIDELSVGKRSSVLRVLLEDEDEKLHGMRVISEHLMPRRWDELREPLGKEIKMTGVIAVDIESASAKVSSGLPDDEDEDYAIPIWAGVLPLESRLTALVDDDRLIDAVETVSRCSCLAESSPITRYRCFPPRAAAERLLFPGRRRTLSGRHCCL